MRDSGKIIIKNNMILRGYMSTSGVYDKVHSTSMRRGPAKVDSKPSPGFLFRHYTNTVLDSVVQHINRASPSVLLLQILNNFDVHNFLLSMEQKSSSSNKLTSLSAN
eukprot:5097739-Ditylum_brightwellii.AAC.1